MPILYRKDGASFLYASDEMPEKSIRSVLPHVSSESKQRCLAKKLHKNTGSDEMKMSGDQCIGGIFQDCTFFWASCPFFKALTARHWHATRSDGDAPGWGLRLMAIGVSEAQALICRARWQAVL